MFRMWIWRTSLLPNLFNIVMSQVNVFGFLNDNPQRLRKFATAKTRFAITCLATYYMRIAVGDCRDGILFFTYHEVLLSSLSIFCFSFSSVGIVSFSFSIMASLCCLILPST